MDCSSWHEWICFRRRRSFWCGDAVPVLLRPRCSDCAEPCCHSRMSCSNAKKRLAAFSVNRSRSAELLGRSCEAGHSLQSRIGLVGEEMEEALWRSEFKTDVTKNKVRHFHSTESDRRHGDRIPTMTSGLRHAVLLQRSQTAGVTSAKISTNRSTSSRTTDDPRYVSSTHRRAA